MYPENREQGEWLLAGVEAAVQAVGDTRRARIAGLPEWKQYAPDWALGGDLRARFWQCGFVKHYNIIAERMGWPQFRLILPLPGYEKSESN